MDLLRGPMLAAYEESFAKEHGFLLSSAWGDSQLLTRELASSGICLADIETLLRDEAPALTAFSAGVLGIPDDGEQWPEGYEPDADELPVEVPAPRQLAKGFALHHACALWLVRQPDPAPLLAWLKFRCVPQARKYAAELRAAAACLQ